MHRTDRILLIAVASVTFACTSVCNQNCPEIPMSEHTKRVVWTLGGCWKPEYQEGRNSESKGYWGELGHSLKNWWIELFRKCGIYNRKDRPPDKCEGYLWP